jgi:hypothetical protein
MQWRSDYSAVIAGLLYQSLNAIVEKSKYCPFGVNTETEPPNYRNYVPQQWHLAEYVSVKCGYALVTLPRTVTPYRDSVDGTRYHMSIKRSLSGNVTGILGALSVFGRRIEGMIRLRSEQVRTCNVTRHHRPLLSPSLHS